MDMELPLDQSSQTPGEIKRDCQVSINILPRRTDGRNTSMEASQLPAHHSLGPAANQRRSIGHGGGPLFAGRINNSDSTQALTLFTYKRSA